MYSMIREDLNKVIHYLSPHPLEEIVVDVYQYIDIIYTVYNVHFSASTRKMLVSLEGTKGRRCCRCSMKPEATERVLAILATPGPPLRRRPSLAEPRHRCSRQSHPGLVPSCTYLVNTRHDYTYPLNKPQSSSFIEAKVLQQIITLEMVLVNWILKLYVLKYSIESNICKKTKSGKVDKFCAL